jgi:uncharacterized protein YecT (DUF1311 family)
MMKSGLFLLALWAGNALAQYDGPAVESCRAYAAREAKTQIVLERDRFLLIERYTRKVGSQFVSSVLTGNGALVYPNAPSAELSFLCLLADEKRPVFFAWLPRQDGSTLAQCTRDDSLRAKSLGCLEALAQIAEQDLGPMYTDGLQEASRRGAAAEAAFRKSNEEWREYRDAECRRQRDLGTIGAPAERELACRVDLTRRRALDLR